MPGSGGRAGVCVLREAEVSVRVRAPRQMYKGGVIVPGVSTKTKVMMVRLPVEAATRVERNARRVGVSVSEYMRRIVVTQVMRKR